MEKTQTRGERWSVTREGEGFRHIVPSDYACLVSQKTGAIRDCFSFPLEMEWTTPQISSGAPPVAPRLCHNSADMTSARRITKVALALLCAVSLGLTLFGATRYFGYERSIVDPLKEDLVRRTREAATRIDTSLAPAREAAEAMAARLDALAEPTEDRLLALLREAILSDESCFGGTIDRDHGQSLLVSGF